jgi:hypothetical protein
VWVSPPAGSIGPGPTDDRMYVVDPIHKDQPYAFPDTPPYRQAVHPPVQPNEFGHFDHLDVNSRAFKAAHIYASLRRVLDIWEGYYDRPIDWHFQEQFDRLEVIPQLDWDNAQSGYGFIEAGHATSEDGVDHPFSLNFDVLAHELGHSIIFSEVGFPTEGADTTEFLGFHESASDMVALISVLHFNSVVDHLLSTTRGNLYTLNELNRIGELSDTDQIRVASNDLTMSDFSGGWKKVHDLSQPLTGAIFDTMVDVFQRGLLENGLISPELWDLAERVPEEPVDPDQVQMMFDQAYQGRHQDYKDALLYARDYMGELLTRTWNGLSPHYLTFADVGDALLAADRDLTGGAYQNFIFENFEWRRIGAVAPGPRLSDPSKDTRLQVEGDAAPDPGCFNRNLSYWQRMELARRGV